MADNIDVTPGTGKTVKTTDVAGEQIQNIIVTDTSGTAIDWTAPVPVTQSGAWNITNISGTVSLPTGAATEASLVKIPLAQGSTTSGQSGALMQGAVTTAAPSYTTAQTSPLSLTTGGALRVDASAGGTMNVTGTGTAASPAAGLLSIQGLQADDAALGATATNPVPMGGKYNATRPTYTDGDRTQAQFDVRGNLGTALYSGNTLIAASTIGDGHSVTGSPVLFTGALGMAWNGTNYDRIRSVTDASGVSAGTGLLATVSAPTTAAAAAVAPSALTAAGSNRVLKTSAGNLYSINVVSGASAGVVYVFNAISLPSNGAVTPVKAYIMAANSERTVTFSPPLRLSTGITIGFGTGTDPFTLAASTTAFISGEAV